MSHREPYIRAGGAATDPRETAATWGFALLFPGFLVYHYGVSASWWSPVLGGMFANSASVIVIIAGLVYLQRWRYPLPRPTLIHVLFFILVAYQLSWSLVFTGLLRVEHAMLAALIESVGTVTIWLALLFVGSHFPRHPLPVTFLNIVGWCSLAICFGHAFFELGFPAGPFLAFGSIEDGSHSTYQGIGRSLLVIGVVSSLAYKPDSPRSLLVLFLIVLLLLVLGSRAHFFAAIVLILLHVALLSVGSATRYTGLFGLAVVLLLAAYSVDLFLATRAAEILDLGSSTSWQGRTSQNLRALEIISDDFFVGSFGHYYWDSIGYPHNILSAWTQFGLLGFLIFVGLLVLALGTSVEGYIKDCRNRAAWTVALYCNVVAIVLALASEPIMLSVFPPLAWGLTLRAQRLRYENQSRTQSLATGIIRFTR